MELEQLEIRKETYNKYGTTDLNELWAITSYSRNGEVFSFEMPLRVMVNKIRVLQQNKNTITELINKINSKSTI